MDASRALKTAKPTRLRRPGRPSKLTDADRVVIYDLYTAPESVETAESLATRFDVSPRLIYRVLVEERERRTKKEDGRSRPSNPPSGRAVSHGDSTSVGG